MVIGHSVLSIPGFSAFGNRLSRIILFGRNPFDKRVRLLYDFSGIHTRPVHRCGRGGRPERGTSSGRYPWPFSWPSIRARPVPGRSSSMTPARLSPRPRRSSASTIPGPAGWSTIPWRFGKPRPAWRPWPFGKRACAPPTSPRSASPTSGRRRWSGSAPRGGRSITPSSGRTAAPPPPATA